MHSLTAPSASPSASLSAPASAPAGRPHAATRDLGATWLGIALGLLALSLLVQMVHFHHWYGLGGSHWAQADWLINLAAGPIRRGPLGEALLMLARATGLPVLDLLMGLQVAMTLALYGLAAWLLWSQPDRLAVMAVFSAAFFVMLIGASPGAGGRKEILGYLALLLLACPGGGRGRIAASAGLLALAAIGHEVGVLFLPAWAAGLWLIRPQALRDPVVQGVAGAVALAVLGAAAYALSFRHLPDTAPLCAAIHAAGPVAAGFCDGAIDWLADADGGTARVLEVLAAMGLQLAGTVAVMALATLPLLALLWYCRAPHRVLLGLALAVAPFVLLYPVGLDWGRWLSIQYSTAAFLTLGMMQRRILIPQDRPGARQLAGWLALALTAGLTLLVTVQILAFPLVALAAILSLL